MRIIGGSLRGRDLGAVPKGVRPTSDRVRESLFSILGPLDGKRVLDLFSGTGALGLEAYSRGAASIVFVEQSRRVANALRARLRNLDLEARDASLTVMTMAAIQAVRRLSARLEGQREGREGLPGEGQGESQFDLVFLDPPYAEGDRIGTLEALFASSLLATDAVVVVEGPKRHPLPPVVGGRVLEQRPYGDTILTWLAAAKRSER